MTGPAPPNAVANALYLVADIIYYLYKENIDFPANAPWGEPQVFTIAMLSPVLFMLKQCG